MRTTDPVVYPLSVRLAVAEGLRELVQVHGTRSATKLGHALVDEIDTYLLDWAASDRDSLYWKASSEALTEVWLMLGFCRYKASTIHARRCGDEVGGSAPEEIEDAIQRLKRMGEETGDWHWCVARLAESTFAACRSVDASWQPPEIVPPAETGE